MELIVFISIGAVVLLIFIFITLYNGLINRRNNVENAFGGIDAQLKKRYDLIPNLVTAVKKYMEHEKSVLEQLTELRTQALASNLNNDQKIDLNEKINDSLKSLMIAVENYPDLKANQNFIHLQQSLNEVEGQISAARRAYNSAVTEYNNAVEMFPSNIVAGIYRFKRKKVFEIAESERKNVDLKKLF